MEGSPFRLHRKLVRDVSWHPFDPVMATVSWVSARMCISLGVY